MTTIELAPTDAAIVIRGDGALEGFIPDDEDENGDALEVAVTATVLLMIAGTPALLAKIRGIISDEEEPN